MVSMIESYSVHCVWLYFGSDRRKIAYTFQARGDPIEKDGGARPIFQGLKSIFVGYRSEGVHPVASRVLSRKTT